MSYEEYATVWDAIEDTPEAAENMKLRSVMMMILKDRIVHAGLTQAQAAKCFGVTRSRVSDLMHGRIDLFAVETLVNMAAVAGVHVETRILDAA
jgi:predicted XRE-type DNA-binding protein